MSNRLTDQSLAEFRWVDSEQGDSVEAFEAIDLPDVRQSTNYSCGAAALECVLKSIGAAYSEAELRQALGTTPAGGTDVPAIAALAARLGLSVHQGTMTVADLTTHTAAGRPVICPIQADDPDSYQGGHYVVVKGCDGETVAMQDPSAGPVSMPVVEWEERWHDRDQDGTIYEHYGIAVGK